MEDKIYLIDSSGYFYRAYYGLPELENDDGRNVNAIYGFFRMFFKLLKKQTDYIAIVGDSPKKTLRHQDFDEYKANRKKTPDNLKWQMGLIKEIIDKLDYPFFQIPGYEADDIITTIGQNIVQKHEDKKAYIISSDKDLKQVLTERIIFWDTFKNTRTNKKQFIKEYGFEPKYLLDYLALCGDSSDNIPGIDGIGPKTASKLIKEYGDLDTIYSNINEISWGIQDKLQNGKESAYKSKKLIELYDVPGMDNVSLDDMKIDVNFDGLRRILVEEYDFQSFDKKISKLEKIYDIGTQDSLF